MNRKLVRVDVTFLAPSAQRSLHVRLAISIRVHAWHEPKLTELALVSENAGFFLGRVESEDVVFLLEDPV